MMKKLAFTTTALFILSACTTVDPYTREDKMAKGSTGAMIGAAVGAGVGALTSSKKDRGKGALIGAGAGAALGGSVGYYMDVQEAKLRDELAQTGVSVTRQGNQIILNMPNNVTFDSSESNIKPQGANTLRGVAMVLKEYNRTSINVIGHTDSTGSDALNSKLSRQRAESVASQLIMMGVDQNRIQMYGAGPREPLVSNATPEGRAQNRRVEITLNPPAQ